jgi:hypothetical protein
MMVRSRTLYHEPKSPLDFIHSLNGDKVFYPCNSTTVNEYFKNVHSKKIEFIGSQRKSVELITILTNCNLRLV